MTTSSVDPLEKYRRVVFLNPGETLEGFSPGYMQEVFTTFVDLPDPADFDTGWPVRVVVYSPTQTMDDMMGENGLQNWQTTAKQLGRRILLLGCDVVPEEPLETKFSWSEMLNGPAGGSLVEVVFVDKYSCPADPLKALLVALELQWVSPLGSCLSSDVDSLFGLGAAIGGDLMELKFRWVLFVGDEPSEHSKHRDGSLRTLKVVDKESYLANVLH
jgi:hypothetical protein